MKDTTLGDLKTISYWTRQEFEDKHHLAWQLKIYTVDPDFNPDAGDKAWYNKRFNIQTPQYEDTDWHKNTTEDNLQFSWVYDKINKKDIAIGDIGSGKGPLEDMTEAYSTESILFIDIIAGYAAKSPSVYSYLDGVMIELSNEKKAVINLEAD